MKPSRNIEVRLGRGGRAKCAFERKGQKRRGPRPRYASVEDNVVWLLRNTMMQNKEIAEQVGIDRSKVSVINRRHNCRSVFISKVLGAGRGLKWERISKTNFFNNAQRQEIIRKNKALIRELVGKPKTWVIKGKKVLVEDFNAIQRLNRSLFEALGHYNPNLCSELVFTRLVIERVLKMIEFEQRQGQRK